MAKKIKHLPPDLPYPGVMDKLDCSTINGQQPFYTPLTNGKEPCIKDSTNKGMNNLDCLSLVGQNDNKYTGIGLNHKLSNTVAFDIDDVLKTKAYFKNLFYSNFL